MDHTRDARRRMVEIQIKGRGIVSPRVLEAFENIPRHRFVPLNHVSRAYEDHPVSIACAQTISQPYMVARMTELLDLLGEERVLEIGTGSGYQTAILASLSGHVTTIERFGELSCQAKQVLDELQIQNVDFIVGDGSVGDREHAPFDRILISAASPSMNEELAGQMSEEGKMVMPVGSRSSQMLYVVQNSHGTIRKEEYDACVFVPLIGRLAWQESEL